MSVRVDPATARRCDWCGHPKVFHDEDGCSCSHIDTETLHVSPCYCTERAW